MQSKTLRFGKGFRVAFAVRKAQAAEMVLAPGDSEGDADNRHRGADQWLYVVSGSGLAIVEGKRIALKAGRLLVIERGERHEVRNTGHGLLKTLNFYCPPADDRERNPVGSGRNDELGASIGHPWDSPLFPSHGDVAGSPPSRR